jgi:hypothetical protein
MKNTIRMLVLAVSACALIMAIGVSAKDRDNHLRPFKMDANSVMVIQLPSYSVTAQAQGVASHLGAVVMEGHGNPMFVQGTITAANGDVIQWQGNPNTGVYTITGGTGRFEEATGGFTVVVQPVSSLLDPVAHTITNTYIWTASGTISY